MQDRLEGRRVLVIGGGGYIGNVLVRQLLDAGSGVAVLDSLQFEQGCALAGLWENERFGFTRGDLRDGAALEMALEGVTDVVLLAAIVGDPAASKYPELAQKVNVDGAKAVFEALRGRGIDRFVFTSTCSNYGLRSSDELATENSELAPVSLYAEHKVEFEKFVLGTGADADFCPTILRIATAYGLSPRMRFDLTISEFTRTLATGQELLVYDADTWRPYCHVRDISSAIIRVLGSDAADVRGEVFNVGHSDENYTKRMIVEAVLENLDGTPAVRFEEGGRDPRNYRVSFEKIADRLGFEARFTVPASIANLVRAVQAGVFDDVEERPYYYADHTIPGLEGG